MRRAIGRSALRLLGWQAQGEFPPEARGGCVLLSQFDVADDFTLRRNTSITVQTHGLVVIEAIEASVLEVDSVAQEYLQQLVQITLAAQRRAHVLGRHLQQIFTLRRQ